MLTIDALKEYGANVEEGLTRCMNNEAFYFRLIKMAAEDAGFGRLKDAVASGDLEAGFEAAHGLKGVLGNLALTPVYTPVSEMTELFRAKKEADYASYLAQVQEQLDRLKALID